MAAASVNHKQPETLTPFEHYLPATTIALLKPLFGNDLSKWTFKKGEVHHQEKSGIYFARLDNGIKPGQSNPKIRTYSFAIYIIKTIPRYLNAIFRNVNYETNNATYFEFTKSKDDKPFAKAFAIFKVFKEKQDSLEAQVKANQAKAFSEKKTYQPKDAEKTLFNEMDAECRK